MSANPSRTPAPDPRQQVTTRALVVWSAALITYVFAITSRTSFGVAGVDAMDRFSVDASRLAVFVAVQLCVYALAQVPTGLLIDKFGPRAIMTCGAVIMGSGQLLLAFTESYPLAIGARVLIGLGDAGAFLSAMRLLPNWFPIRIAPLFTQLTAGIGQLGQVISAVPFLIFLHASGWTPAFAVLGGSGFVVALLAVALVADSPDCSTRDESSSPKIGLRGTLGVVVKHPACWQGFFTHYVGMIGTAVFMMLWGLPMMNLGMGLSATTAGTVLVAGTLAMVFTGPLTGYLSSRLGRRRTYLAMASAVIQLALWVAFFLSDTPRSLTFLLVVVLVMGSACTMANLAFDTVREELDRRVLATATGLANMGGFLSAMASAMGIGLLLDFSSATGDYTWTDFRFAWIALTIPWALGLIGLVYFTAATNRRNRADAMR